LTIRGGVWVGLSIGKIKTKGCLLEKGGSECLKDVIQGEGGRGRGGNLRRRCMKGKNPYVDSESLIAGRGGDEGEKNRKCDRLRESSEGEEYGLLSCQVSRRRKKKRKHGRREIKPSGGFGKLPRERKA